eukprot:TRINITY_DN6835_c0_g1_i1.p1 TRINITY_DN6835_c0_g1~~TRINITY_DN6835_c0_g1_i1.p1  ORF type:complete len:710 (+),score=164.64 TRINITY_DN6835_c0_g1_i1:213-2342(+)
MDSNDQCCHAADSANMAASKHEHAITQSPASASVTPTKENAALPIGTKKDFAYTELPPNPHPSMEAPIVEQDVFHPLDDLTEREMKKAATIIRAELNHPKRIGFCQIMLHEPPKKIVREFDTAKVKPSIYREAFCIVLDQSHEKTYEIYVALSPVGHERVVSCVQIKGVQPPLLSNEYEICEDIVKNDPRVVAALKKRGITDVSKIMVDLWIGFFADPKHRLSNPLLFYRADENSNGYARPIDGLDIIVDLNRMKVLEVKELFDAPIPPYDPMSHWQTIQPVNKAVKPISITQPEGVSFTIDGQKISWMNWSFRIGFNKREGLVLHTVTYNDKGKDRPVMYRASIAEMVVPYGDPRHPNYLKNAFDAGEDGLGIGVHSLELGCDCLGSIYYLDVALVDGNGTPYIVKNAICIHEEDAGVLWKHKEWRTNTVGVRRSHKLVVSFFTTIANYDYGFFWYFLQDGTIKFELKLTGIMSASAIKDGESPLGYGVMIAPNLYAPIHQHFMTARLDMQVDGINNFVEEINVKAPEPHEHNPHKSAYYAYSTVFHTERQAQRAMVPARAWRVVNPKTTNRLGENCAWRLIPQHPVNPFASSDSAIMFKASHLRNSLWVTPFDAKERYPAGNYTIQKAIDDGLTKWTLANRNIYNTDVVLWHNFGLTHVARSEDWPVMPAEYCGFILKPDNFFDWNPSINIPPTRYADSCCDVKAKL